MTGFENLAARQRKQEEMATLLAADMEKMQGTLRDIADERQVSLELRLRHYRARQQLLSHRVLKLMATLESQQVRHANENMRHTMTRSLAVIYIDARKRGRIHTAHSPAVSAYSRTCCIHLYCAFVCGVCVCLCVCVCVLLP